MALGKDYARQDCSLARALEIVGERWTLLVLRDCLYGVRRFTDLRAHLDIPRAVLAERLADLTAAGLLQRREYRPNRHEYVVTARALDLWPALYALVRWGERQFAPAAGPRRVYTHAPCGTPLDETGACPDCGGPVPAADVVIGPGPGADFGVRDDPVSRAPRTPHRLLTPLPATSD